MERETRLLSEPILETKVSHSEFQFVVPFVIERNARDAFFQGRRIRGYMFFFRAKVKERWNCGKGRRKIRRIILENQYRFIWNNG